MRKILHLRVIAPVELRDRVIDALTAKPGVAHLVVHRDAALDPPDDEIAADVARESANDIIDTLKALKVTSGAIALYEVDTVLSTRAYRAEEVAAGDPAALVGVFISATTVPAAGFAVVAASIGDWDIAVKSAAQLAINLVGIALAGILVLHIRRIADRRHWHMTS